MKPFDKGLVFVILALLASQVASQRGCTLPDWPDVIPTPGPSAERVWAIIADETGDRHAWFGALKVELRNAERDGKLPASMVKLDILDDDEAMQDSVKAMLGEQLTTTKQPALFAVDADSKQVVSATTLTDADTVETVAAKIGGDQ